MRIIDADELIKNIKLYINRSFLGEISSCSEITIGSIASIINDTPAINQWIPSSERLPEETGYYICSVEWYGTSTKELLVSNGYEIQNRIMLVHFLKSNNSFKEAENWSEYKVIAWQPLPEKHKGE